MTKNAIATMVIGERHKNIFELTKKNIFNYAKKINADLVVYNDHGYSVITQSGSKQKIHNFKSKQLEIARVDDSAPDDFMHNYDESWHKNALKKLNIVELLENYERVLFIDCDILIREDSPNIFDIVPTSMVGMYNESTPFENYKEDFMKLWCERFSYDYSKWNGQHYNSGVTVFSRGHELLYSPPKFVYRDMFYDQTHLNANIMNFNIPMYDLPYQFNRIFFIDHLVPDSRYESFFIHYAGSWHLLEEGHSENPKYLLEVIQYDLDVLEGRIKKPNPEEIKKANSEKWWEI
jgi:lipopolysaccharide biosynthesis glycosyltransferase